MRDYGEQNCERTCTHLRQLLYVNMDSVHLCETLAAMYKTSWRHNTENRTGLSNPMLVWRDIHKHEAANSVYL